MVHNLLQIILIIEIDGLLIWKENRQMMGRGHPLMHGEFCNVPKSLRWTNVTGPNVFQYFTYIFTNTNGGMIMTLVYILVNVLDGLYRCTHFNINVVVVLCREIWIIWNNIAVVKDLAVRVGIGPAIVWSGIFRITIFTQASFSTEILWKILASFSINHARSIWEFRTAGTMHHALCNSGIEQWVSNWIRDLAVSGYN